MLEDKIKGPGYLKKITDRYVRKGRTIGFTNGCFDILHYGHVKYLEAARKHCDILIVAVNDDGSVKRLKGEKRPIFSLKDRTRVLAALSSVDYVTWFKQDTPIEIIEYLRPDIIIKGADYKKEDIVGGSIVKSYGGKVKRIRYIKGYSVTGIIDNIIGFYKKS
jgi:rfaE bifunctional protein nucleotidyltransferase chain/domain